MRFVNKGFKKVDSMVVEKLRQLKEKSHMTNQQIAEKSNIPESTVARIFSGKTPNPTIATAVSMARAMGGSAADFFNEEDIEKGTDVAEVLTDEKDAAISEDEKGCAPEHGSPTDNTAYDRYYLDMIEFYKSMLKKKDEWIARLFWCLVVVMAFIFFVLIFDILHPSFGFVKY